MALQVHIDAKAKIFRLFDLRQLMGEADLDLSEIDLSQSDEIQNLYDRVMEFVETGEVGAYDDMLFHLHGIDPEICEITLQNGEEKVVSTDDITLKNESVASELQKKLERYAPGSLFLATLTTGDAAWDFMGDGEPEKVDPAKLTMRYVDCSEEADTYEIIAGALYEDLCDVLSTDNIRYARQPLELQDFVLHPKHLFGKLFVVRKALESSARVLERIDPPHVELQDGGWILLQSESGE